MRRFLLACALFASVGCQESAGLSDYRVSGYVRDPLTGNALSGVRVTFTSDTLHSKSTTTSGDGSYDLRVKSDTPLGQVKAEKSGYESAQATVFFDSSERRIDLAIRPLPSDAGP